ncbi:MAG: hypothetical protein KDA89_13100 [Planctomycetaceae bacterium]|nr:hypothetical protein [Planctomycetaceae bacterium]
MNPQAVKPGGIRQVLNSRRKRVAAAAGLFLLLYGTADSNLLNNLTLTFSSSSADSATDEFDDLDAMLADFGVTEDAPKETNEPASSAKVAAASGGAEAFGESATGTQLFGSSPSAAGTSAAEPALSSAPPSGTTSALTIPSTMSGTTGFRSTDSGTVASGTTAATRSVSLAGGDAESASASRRTTAYNLLRDRSPLDETGSRRRTARPKSIRLTGSIQPTY